MCLCCSKVQTVNHLPKEKTDTHTHTHTLQKLSHISKNIIKNNNRSEMICVITHTRTALWKIIREEKQICLLCEDGKRFSFSSPLSFSPLLLPPTAIPPPPLHSSPVNQRFVFFAVAVDKSVLPEQLTKSNGLDKQWVIKRQTGT